MRLRWVALALLSSAIVAEQAHAHLMIGAKQVYFRFLKGRQFWLDSPAAVSAYLGPRLDQRDTIYVVDDEPIIYFLANAQLPTRFVFPPFLVRRVDLPNLANISPREELAGIMSVRPKYVVKRQREIDPYYVPENRDFFEVLRSYLWRDYTLEKSIEGLDIYRLKSEPLYLSSPAR